jgi:hypothetical protein
VLCSYLVDPDRPEVAARLVEMSRAMKANLAAGKAWEGGLYQSVDLRPLLGRIISPTLIVAGELDFISGGSGIPRTMTAATAVPEADRPEPGLPWPPWTAITPRREAR